MRFYFLWGYATSININDLRAKFSLHFDEMDPRLDLPFLIFSSSLCSFNAQKLTAGALFNDRILLSTWPLFISRTVNGGSAACMKARHHRAGSPIHGYGICLLYWKHGFIFNFLHKCAQNGASYCTSELSVHKSGEIHTWDRGFDEEGNQVRYLWKHNFSILVITFNRSHLTSWMVIKLYFQSDLGSEGRPLWVQARTKTRSSIWLYWHVLTIKPCPSSDTRQEDGRLVCNGVDASPVCVDAIVFLFFYYYGEAHIWFVLPHLVADDCSSVVKPDSESSWIKCHEASVESSVM